MNSAPKIWFNYWEPLYKSTEPNFFDVSVYDWANEIESLTENLKTELKSIIAERGGTLIPYYGDAVGTDGNKWATLGFKTWGIEVKPNIEKSPTIRKILNKYPFIVSASVNMLMPNAEIKPHQGDTNAIFRCHLGIEVLDTLPDLGFEVEGEKSGWENGKLLVFTDAKKHCGWNRTENTRIIFLFDVIREEFRDQQKQICIKVRSLLLLQWLVSKMGFVKKLPKWIHWIIVMKIRLLLWIIHPYQKRKGVILKHT